MAFQSNKSLNDSWVPRALASQKSEFNVPESKAAGSSSAAAGEKKREAAASSADGSKRAKPSEEEEAATQASNRAHLTPAHP